MTRRTTLLAIAATAVIGVVLRLHFRAVPLNTDEGGFAAIARLWREGYALYGNVAWVDRPQGLLVLYRLAGLADSDQAIRALAIAASLVTLAAVAAAAWAVAGRAPAVAAAGLYAVLSPAPHLEGFTANGELLSGALAAAGAALALWWTVRRHLALLIAAAFLAGCAPLVKQSAIDGVVVVAAAVIVVADRRLRNLLLAAVVGLLPAGLAVLHAATATAGLSDWWYAIVGYRSSTESAVSGDVGSRLHLLLDAVPPALQDLVPLLALAPLGFRRGRSLLLGVWLGAGRRRLPRRRALPPALLDPARAGAERAGRDRARPARLAAAGREARIRAGAGPGAGVLRRGLHDPRRAADLGADERRLAARDRSRRRAPPGRRDEAGPAGLRDLGERRRVLVREPAARLPVPLVPERAADPGRAGRRAAAC